MTWLRGALRGRRTSRLLGVVAYFVALAINFLSLQRSKNFKKNSIKVSRSNSRPSPESSRRSGRRPTRRTDCCPRHSLGPPAGESRILKGEFKISNKHFCLALFLTGRVRALAFKYSPITNSVFFHSIGRLSQVSLGYKHRFNKNRHLHTYATVSTIVSHFNSNPDIPASTLVLVWAHPLSECILKFHFVPLILWNFTWWEELCFCFLFFQAG